MAELEQMEEQMEMEEIETEPLEQEPFEAHETEEGGEEGEGGEGEAAGEEQNEHPEGPDLGAVSRARSRSRTPPREDPRESLGLSDGEDLFPPEERNCRFCGEFKICEFGREENFCSRRCYNQSMKGCN